MHTKSSWIILAPTVNQKQTYLVTNIITEIVFANATDLF